MYKKLIAALQHLHLFT